MDEELAEQIEEAGENDDKRPPTLAVSETTPEVLLLLRLVALGQAQLQAKQAKRIPFPPLPSIRTARAAVRARLRLQHRGRLEARVAEAQARWAELQDTAPADPAAQQTWIDQSTDPT